MPSPLMVTVVTVQLGGVCGGLVVRLQRLVPAVDSDVERGGPPDVPNPPVPVTVVNATLDPACTSFVSSAAVGDGGAVTVGVMDAMTRWPSESAAAYLIGAVTTPVKLDKGVKVTTPVEVFRV